MPGTPAALLQPRGKPEHELTLQKERNQPLGDALGILNQANAEAHPSLEHSLLIIGLLCQPIQLDSDPGSHLSDLAT